jgi:isopentenyl phosphate kinase
MLAGILKPGKVIFAVNVDGVYQDMDNGKIVGEIDDTNFKSLDISKVKLDITGGMKRKMTEAMKMASLGMNVMIVNGLVPRRIVDVITDKKVEGTLIRAAREVKHA